MRTRLSGAIMTSNIKLGIDTYSVQGKIFDVVTRAGIDNLLVTIYDVARDAGTTAAPFAEWMKSATRIGIVQSDAYGQFSFTYDKDDFTTLVPNRKRLYLLVVISAPA